MRIPCGGWGITSLQTKLRSGVLRRLGVVAYLRIHLASWESLTWWFQIEPSLLRSSGVKRTYWLVSIVLPWKSQRGMELEPTPVGREGCRQVRKRPCQQWPCQRQKTHRAALFRRKETPLTNPIQPRPHPALIPAPGLTLVGLDKRMLPLEVFTVAVSYIRNNGPQQQEEK